MAERMLVTKIVRKDNTRADLYAPRRKWADLTLFEIGMLQLVGIDIDKLVVGVETPCLFYALWENSEKLNANGVPYKDVVGVEPYDGTVDATEDMATSLQRVAAALDTLNSLMALLLANQGIEAPAQPTPQPPPQPAELVYNDGSLVAENDTEKAAFRLYVQAHEGDVPENVDSLRTWFAAHQAEGTGQ